MPRITAAGLPRFGRYRKVTDETFAVLCVEPRSTVTCGRIFTMLSSNREALYSLNPQVLSQHLVWFFPLRRPIESRENVRVELVVTALLNTSLL